MRGRSRSRSSGARVALDLTQGITEFSSRIALKMLFGQFGEVAACWVPPLEKRGKEPAYVKFGTSNAAQLALDAANSGQLYLDGVRVQAQWRVNPAKTQDSRDFDAKGSNLITSRDIMRQRIDGERVRRRESERKRSRSRQKVSRSRSQSHSRSPSRRKSRSVRRSGASTREGRNRRHAKSGNDLAKAQNAQSVKRRRPGGSREEPICVDSD
uniref:RRM domain-containing protein n=1 Tax=Noctiluca scintillans TaxID=2966 RepID=A0A7S0ZNM7_NOCSC|mmetsp:Transcript_12355/g.34017  ORF Transcript_12355/g.34017 Transcript_12355/m.34017 type:complete len:212 (+) Transcript_12355:111-746(+)